MNKAHSVSFKMVPGGVTAPEGISACGISAGFRRNPERLDFALVMSAKPAVSAGVFTQNNFCAAPVALSRAHVSQSDTRAVIVNSGNANAATGESGMAVASKSAALVAEELGCSPQEILVASTGVIGVPLDVELFAHAVPSAIAALSKTGGADAARAIMTTDTVPKEAALSYEYGGHVYTIGGMCKGSGMIMPDMATMIAVLTTDAPLVDSAAYTALKTAADCSFNKVTVDSDTSTNDTCILLATGEAGGEGFDIGTEHYDVFLEALRELCTELAKKIARDGEGASCLIEVNVSGAASDEDAELCARAIANSPLVKTAVAGHDANWGRIAMAAGKSGARFDQDKVDISILGIPVCKGGLTLPFDEDDALERFSCGDVAIDIDLGAGESQSRIWTCDFTHGYISINGDYRT